MSFESDLRKAKRELERKVSKIFRLGTIDGMNSIIRLSPRDTGRFAANWSPTLNVPSTKSDWDARTIIDASQYIKDIKVSDVMYLTNNLPYSETLVDNPSPRWVEKEAYKIADYIVRYAAIVDRE